MAVNTGETFEKNMKILWGRLQYSLYEVDPVLAMIRRTSNFVAKQREVVIMHEGTFGSADLARARSNAGTPQLAKFICTRKKDYSVGFLDLEALEAADGNKGSLAKLYATSIKAAMNGISNTDLVQIWGNGGGARGQIRADSDLTTNTIYLRNPSDSVHFGPGINLQSSTDDGTGGAGVLTGETGPLVAIDRDTGALTASAAWNTLFTGLTVDCYLFRDGDYNKALTGFHAWCPKTAPSSGEDFLGQDRSVDVTRLAGVRYAADGGDITDAMVNFVGKHHQQGGRPKVAIVNPLTMSDIQREMHGRVQFGNMQPQKGVGLQYLKMFTGHGEIKVITSRGAPRDEVFFTRMDNWELAGLRGWPHYSRRHGFKMFPNDEDMVEYKLKRYGELICPNPLHNGRMTGLSV